MAAVSFTTIAQADRAPPVQWSNLTLGYNRRPAIHHVTGDIEAGSLTALVGPNGSGKSTLLKGIVGILKPMTGKCTVRTKAGLAYLPQQSELDRTFPTTVGCLVALGLWSRRGPLGRHNAADRMAVAGALTDVGLVGFEDRPIDSLSGGQLQRALFARVMVQDADLILLDEPFNAIDESTVHDLLHHLKRWHADGRTVIAVMHDLDLVRSHFPATLLLAREPIAWGSTKQVLTAPNLAKAGAFSAAWQPDAPWCGHEPDSTRDQRHLRVGQ
ncbi:MAG: metal ABC transporter ATP-binding protein [Rhodospirillaceae bacterium]|nr:metal ABC transporter ATP-binding protein [Rhodospirillaceae bacterium]